MSVVTTGVLLALASAVAYGMVDFVGAMLARRVSSEAVAFAGQWGGLLIAGAVAPFISAESVMWPDIAWGALSGVGSGVGMVFLYRAMSRGDISVAVPLSAVGGLTVPVVVGVVLLGDRPSPLSWLGIAAALPALWFVSVRRETSTGSRVTASTTDALIAAAWIALQYLALAQAAPDSGVWPVVAGRVTAVFAVLPLVLHAASPLRMPVRLTVQSALTGGMAALALVLYLMSTRYELVTIAVVVASLYPVIPVLLGITVLRERPTTTQIGGLMLAAVAVVLLGIG